MKVLSLFDGISVARLALQKNGIYVENYYASEVDEYAIKIARKNFPTTVQLGDVRAISPISRHELNDIDLLIGGSPCQDLSIAKHERKGLEGDRSGLFWEYVRILKEVKPKWFVLENVNSMPKEVKELITKTLGVEPIMIDAALVSAQNRKRLFWTNITVEQPADRGIVLKDIIDQNSERKFLTVENRIKTKNGVRWDTSGKGHMSQNDRAYLITGKFPTIPTARTNTKVNFLFEDGIGVMNWDEIEKLQSLPVGYTDLGNENRLEKRGGVIGNAFNVEVVAHILKNLKQ
jgi:DNA (cytosine-5)-methyltransferase 3A